MPNFMDALQKPVDQIEKPKPKPAGTYLSMIQGLPKVKKITAQGEEREILSFVTKPLMAHAVEDQEALADAGEITGWPPQSIDFWDDETGINNAKMFCINGLGIDPGPDGKAKTLGQMIAESTGKQVLTTYENYPYQDKNGETQIGTRIKSWAKV